MDNFKMMVRSEGRVNLERALLIALSNTPGHKATHYSMCVEGELLHQTPIRTLLLLWNHAGKNAQPLLYELDEKNITDFVYNWLSQQKARAGRYVSSDVSLGNGGFEVEVGDWGHAGGDFFGIALIRPVWAWYGK